MANIILAMLALIVATSGYSEMTPRLPIKIEIKDAKLTRALKRTLKVRLNKSSDYYFDGFRVTTTPIDWQATSRKLTMELKLARLVGTYRESEVEIGRIRYAGVVTLMGEKHLLQGVSVHDFQLSDQTFRVQTGAVFTTL